MSDSTTKTRPPGPAAGRRPGIARVHVMRRGDLPPVDPRAVREALELTQEEFATIYGLNLRSMQGWEQGRPMDTAAVALYTIIGQEPAAATRAIKKARTISED